MKRFTKSWYQLDVFGLVLSHKTKEIEIRYIVTKSNIVDAARDGKAKGYLGGLRLIPMGKIKDLSASQAREVNTFIPDYF